MRFLGTSTRELVPWTAGDLVSKIQYGGRGMDDCFMRAAYNEEFAMCGASEAMQVLGGVGYLRGHPVERIYREVKVMAIGGGSEEIMRDLAVRQMGR